MVKRRAGKRKITRRKAVRRREIKRKPISRKLVDMFRHRVVREVLSAILIIAILYFGIQGAMFIILRTDSPIMAVSSNSMKPTFERGDLVFIKGVDSPGEIKENDIIVFRLEGDQETIVHRVVKIENNNGQVQFTTKGDASSKPDQHPVSFEEVKGKVIFWIPKLGYVSLWIQGE